jgi:hypothetical protein
MASAARTRACETEEFGALREIARIGNGQTGEGGVVVEEFDGAVASRPSTK